MIAFRPHSGAQERFMSFDGRYALYGGAAMGGKTEVLRFDPFRQIVVETARMSLPVDHPHHIEAGKSRGRSIFFRRTMPELREAMDRCFRDFEAIAPGANWSAVDKTWTFPCGYKYMFGQMEEEGDWRKYLGFEFTWVGFDELTTFTEEQFEMLDTRLRSVDPVLKDMLYMRAGTNPVGIGVAWVKRRFVDVAPPNTPVIRRIKVKKLDPETNDVIGEETVERKQIFIPAKVQDNKSANVEEYTATLSSHSVAIRKQLLEGSWEHIHGAFFSEELDPDVHFCKPFKIPAGWFKFRAGDYGYSAPASVQWYAVDHDGNMTCYRSLTVRKHTAEMLAYRIKEIETEAGEWDVGRGMSKLSGPLDSSCWAVTGTVGPSIAETMAQIGVGWRKCTKDRHAAADQVRQRLMKRSGHPTLKDKAGKPLMVVPGIRWFNTCWNMDGKTRTGPIVTLPRLPADEHDPDVPDTRADDHDYDAASYACMSRPLSAESADNLLKDEEDELERMRAKKTVTNTQSGQRSGYPGMWVWFLVSILMKGMG